MVVGLSSHPTQLLESYYLDFPIIRLRIRH